MVQRSPNMWVWMCTCFLLMPSWSGKNAANARSSEIPPWVARDINSKCLTSPGYPNNYPDHSDTNQTLSVPAGQSIEITFQDFNIESHPSCIYDYLEFFDENGEVTGKKLCGDSLPQKFTIPTSTATVLFHSDFSERRKGFKLCYKPGSINDMCLTSPGYPDNYPDNSDTEQTLSVPAGKSIEITFQDFNVEANSLCSYDYVEFSDGNGEVFGKKICGDSLPQKFIIPTSTASVLFHSDRSERRKGFKFCYKPVIMNTCKKCGVKTNTRIVGGVEASVNEYPWMVKLSIAQSIYVYRCGGSVIADRWVLTAAHCFYIDGEWVTDPSATTVSLGEHDLASNSETNLTKSVTPDQIITHEAYNSRLDLNDIALVRLPSAIDLNMYTPVCLPPQGKNYTGKRAWVYGWGALGEHGPLATKLQELEVTILSDADAKDQISVNSNNPKINLTNEQLAVMVFAGGKEGKDSCKGDSGGPVSYNNNGQHELVGVTSWGQGCAREGLPGAYAQVSALRGWIDQKMAQNGGANTC